jgi:hypothetical protein
MAVTPLGIVNEVAVLPIAYLINDVILPLTLLYKLPSLL